MQQCTEVQRFQVWWSLDVDIFRRHDNRESVVIYNPTTQQLVSRRDLPECPYCHRPMADGPGNSGHGVSEGVSGATASFASPEYFRMLHHSQPSSLRSSGPPSPRRRLTQPALSGIATPDNPPREGEFVSSTPAPFSSPGISSTAFSPDYFKRFFVEERELGRGGKGVVLLVKHVLDGVSLGHFALKRIPVGDDHEWLRKVLIEVQLLQHLSHQNLVSYRHVWLEDIQISTFGPSVPCAFVLQQYCNAGDLHNYIYGSMRSESEVTPLKERLRRQSKNRNESPRDASLPRKLQFEEIYAFFKDITAGLNHLHVNGFIHRDLKPQNCLLHKTSTEIRVLVSDFGEVQAENAVRRSTGATGTISYCAPEVLRKEHLTGKFGNFTTKSDIFSLGMILYFLCFADLPYRNADNLNEENEDLDQLREEITAWGGLENTKSRCPDLPDRLYKFLQRLLSLDAAIRPSAEEILQGIKTGAGLNESPDLRPRSAGRLFEEHRAASRISPIETPPPGTPSLRSGSPKRSAPLHRPLPSTKLRLEAVDRRLEGHENDDSQEGSTPTGSLILHPSPTKDSSPPHPPPSTSQRISLYQLSEHTIYTFRILLLALKVISVGFPCMPFAANPPIAIAFLGLATLDLLLYDFGAYVSIPLLLIHALGLSLAMRRGTLCVPKASIWEGI